jgi:hypothetical protein
MVRIVTRILAIACLALGVCTACGPAASAPSTSAPETTPSASLFTAAAARTARAGTARTEMQMTMSSAGYQLQLHATGAYGWNPTRGDINLVMVGGPTGNITIHELLLGHTMYMKSPLLSRNVPTHTPWVKMNLDSVAATQGLGQLMDDNQNNPAQALTLLNGASNSVTLVGKETVRDTPATHYRVVVDYKKLLNNLPAKDRAAIAPTIHTALQAMGGSTLPMDVWVDDDGMVRRLSYQMHMTLPNSQLTTDSSIVMDYFDFGAPVSVKAPPAGEVTDVTSRVNGS